MNKEKFCKVLSVGSFNLESNFEIVGIGWWLPCSGDYFVRAQMGRQFTGFWPYSPRLRRLSRVYTALLSGSIKCLTDHILHFKQLSRIRHTHSLYRAHVPFEYTRSLLSLKVIYRLPASSAVQDTVKSASCARDVDACRCKYAASGTASAPPLFRRTVALCFTGQIGGQHINIYF